MKRECQLRPYFPQSTRNLMNEFACDGFSEFGSKHFGGAGPIHYPKTKKSH